ncbi:hypothetical protein B9Z55_022679 [Caenorhabditis nigoni]|uniref:Uncharacterized protein n=1 Tax=Caenorhabditis nigoni TaxID=1611254 RepID=A0A2G5SLW2_9PELO|nr:hypothetical protein B9Z55_022679 [Caenorhabditis nigoni]
MDIYSHSDLICLLENIGCTFVPPLPNLLKKVKTMVHGPHYPESASTIGTFAVLKVLEVSIFVSQLRKKITQRLP